MSARSHLHNLTVNNPDRSAQMATSKSSKEANKLRFTQINKASVLSDTKEFNKSQINVLECKRIIAKIFYLLYNKERLTTSEATLLFFSTTKLFQSTNTGLRRMVYVLIGELAGTAQDVIIAVSSLTKDINLQQEDLRAQAIRTLCKIIDKVQHSMIQSVERFIRQGMVDSEPTVAVASLVSAYQLYPQSQDTIGRWSAEIQESMSGKNGIHTSYYALGLLYKMRNKDPVARLRLLNSNASAPNLSPLSLCLMARYIHEMFTKHHTVTCNFTRSNDDLLNCLKWMLSSKDDMVSYEAARVICNIPNINGDILNSAVSTLQSMLTAHEPVLIFAALRTLESVSRSLPDLVSCFKLSLESLISHNNANIKKSSTDFDVDYLMKQASRILNDIPDEFKTRIVRVIGSSESLAKSENKKISSFLEEALRENGGYEYKHEIIKTMRNIVENYPETSATYLNILSEYVEDCDFPTLAISAIDFIETYGKVSDNHSRYIRCLYNRLSLENSSVRAASVSAIAGFASVDSLTRENVIRLLKKCFNDPDGEVRDRAFFYFKMLQNYDKMKSIINYDTTHLWDALESRMLGYLEKKEYESQDIDLNSIYKVPKVDELAGKHHVKLLSNTEHASLLNGDGLALSSIQAQDSVVLQTGLDNIYDVIKGIPSANERDLRILKSSDSVHLSDEGAEFVVSCVKHVLPNFWVFQFECKNTLENLTLKNVRVLSKCVSSKFSVEMPLKSEKGIKTLSPGQVAYYYSAFERPKNADNYYQGIIATFSNVMSYMYVENSGDHEITDEYALEELSILISDYIFPSSLSYDEFTSLWGSIGHDSQSVELITLQNISSIKEAKGYIMNLFNMCQTPDQSRIPADSKVVTMKLSGISVCNEPVLLSVKIASSSDNSINLELTVRTADAILRAAVCDAIF